jgi:DNA-binding transcriptional LysR family regulator
LVTLKQLEALYWIAKLDTFERAASKLNTTQSTISKRIRELEVATRTPLFDRSLRTARMTQKGEELFILAEQMLELSQRVTNLSGRSEAPARQLRLGVTELTALTWLPRFIGHLREIYPRLVITAEVDMGRNLYDRLLEDNLDLIIVPDAFADPQIETVTLAHSQNVWMGSPRLIGHARQISVGELAEFTVLMQGSRSGSGQWVSKWLKSHAVVLRNQVSSDSLVALLGMAVAGLGVTYLPRDCFAPLVDDGKLTVIETQPELPSIPYVAMYRKSGLMDFKEQVSKLAKSMCDFSQQLQ